MSKGAIEVIAGPMFSGKTEELLRRLNRSKLAFQDVVAVKPSMDTRYDPLHVCSHAGGRHPAKVVPATDEGVAAILNIGMQPVHVVGIEEVQFFPPSIVDVCRKLKNAGRRVVVTGLDMDFRGEPFGVVPVLLAIGQVTKLSAVCHACGDDAHYTYKKSGTREQVEVGVHEYEARCYKCWSRAQ